MNSLHGGRGHDSKSARIFTCDFVGCNSGCTVGHAAGGPAGNATGTGVHRPRYNASMESGAQQDPRVYFAAERTFLAWIRTGLGLIGIGFAVSRFSLFLREIGGNQAHVPTHATGLSLWSGVLLVALGVVVILSSVVRHIQLVRALKEGQWQSGKVSGQGVALGLILAAAGIGMCVYLVLVR